MTIYVRTHIVLQANFIENLNMLCVIGIKKGQVSWTESAFTEFYFGILVIFPCSLFLVLSLRRGVTYIGWDRLNLISSDCFEVSHYKFPNIWVNLRYELTRLKVKQGEGNRKITFQEADWRVKAYINFGIIEILRTRRVITSSLLSLYI